MNIAFDIQHKRVGPGRPCFVIAEAGVNHNGDPRLARQLIDIAVEAGADAVKFQAFHTDLLAADSAPLADYQQENTGRLESQADMLRRLELSEAQFSDLYAYAHDRGIIFLCTPFDSESAQFLARLGVAAFKVPSGEVTNLPFLAEIAAFARPVIMSTGMANLAEVSEAVRTLKQAGCQSLALLQCVSHYPAPPAQANLRVINTLAGRFSIPVGYSDHTAGHETALAAVALGACIIEKHFTLDRSLPGPDHLASLDPHQLKALILSIRTVEAALGDGLKEPTEAELATSRVVRRSLAVKRDVAAEEVLRADMLQSLRPATGIAPARLPDILGRKVSRPLKAGQILAWADLH